MGGENKRRDRTIRHGHGSSPRGRGKPPPGSAHRAGVRLIPAWAGKTLWRRRAWLGRSAHPRVGGENAAAIWLRWLGRGSSPRGRGKQRADLTALSLSRLIPAWAGKTPADSTRRIVPTAHPRVGGENCYNVNGNKGVTGSSPRGRGKRALSEGRPQCAGLIPAWAGKTQEA